jgi:hypothetical protein
VPARIIDGDEVTHRQWHARVQRLLALSEHDPQRAAVGFHQLAQAVDGGLRTGIHDWHVMQSLHLASVAEAAAGNHVGSAETLERVVDQQHVLLVSEQRAYVSACAAAAIQFVKAGDLRAARRMIRAAEPSADMLRPREKLLQIAKQQLRTRAQNRRRP